MNGWVLLFAVAAPFSGADVMCRNEFIMNASAECYMFD